MAASALQRQSWTAATETTCPARPETTRFFMKSMQATEDQLWAFPPIERKWSRSVVPDSLRPHGQWPALSSSVHGIFKARVLEWVAISFSSRVSSQPRDQTQVSRIVDRQFTISATREVRRYKQFSNPDTMHSRNTKWRLVKSRVKINHCSTPKTTLLIMPS